jgi:nucleotide-binding universal stress UspA family protein
MIRRVVVGVDEGEPAAGALGWAVAEAAAATRVLVIAHAVPRARPAGAALVARAAAFARTRLAPARVQPVVRVGPAGEVLAGLAFAEDTLVLGSGKGSVVRYVLTHASCPVVVVPPRSPVEAPHGPGLVVVQVRQAEAAGAALEFGFGYASRHRLPVAAFAGEGKAARRVSELLPEFRARCPQLPVLTGPPSPASAVALLVVGASASHIGTVARELVGVAPCPVALIRQK